MGVSSSCNEHVFSGWGHILGKRRTRMRAWRQKKQIYIYTNRRVLAGYKKDLAAECDSASENSESIDEDTPLIDLRGRQLQPYALYVQMAVQSQLLRAARPASPQRALGALACALRWRAGRLSLCVRVSALAAAGGS